MTDVTGFGLAGHLLEMCQGANLSATVNTSALPLLPKARDYLAQGCVPGGTHRNFESYGEHLPPLTDEQKALLCDPQTSGGLMIAVAPESEAQLIDTLHTAGIEPFAIGELTTRSDAQAEWIEL